MNQGISSSIITKIISLQITYFPLQIRRNLEGMLIDLCTSLVFHRDPKLSDEEWFHLVFKNVEQIEKSIKDISKNIHKNPLIRHLIKSDPNNRAKNVFVAEKKTSFLKS